MMYPLFYRSHEFSIVMMACLMGVTMFAPRATAGPPASQPNSQSPDPKLQPQDVVRIVVEALSKNDANDSGIRTTWNFASPANQDATGPVERFIPMVKSPAYAPMLNAKSAQFKAPQIQGDQAVQMVLLTGADGNKVGFVFQLSKQGDGPFKGCWMTDAVVPMQPAQQQAPPSGPDQPV